MYRICLSCVCLLVIGCERNSLSPVEIKIDDDSVYSPVDDVTTVDSSAGNSMPGVHIVSDRETLFDIANKYNIDPMNLAKTNGIKHPYKVWNGQRLRLPEGMPVEISYESKFVKYEMQSDEDKKDNKKQETFDKEFTEVMGIKKAEQKKMATSNDQEDALLRPKVTRSALGGAPAAVVTKVSEKEKKPSTIYPIDDGQGEVVSNFGDSSGGSSNDGIDIKAKKGTPVKAIKKGKIIYAGNKLEDFGNTVIIRHEDDTISSYSHLDRIVETQGNVDGGAVIGFVGDTGAAEYPMLHLEVLKDKIPVDPKKYIKQNR